MTTHRIAGIDVHKKMLAVVVLDAAEEGEWRLHRRKFLTTGEDLDALAVWLASLEVREVVMESTAQYWKPVWRVLEPQCHMELAQAQSNRGPRGRKNDFADAERLVRRYVAEELILSFVPDPQQRLWRALSRTKQTLTRDRVRLQNRVEGLLEEMCLKLSSVVSDLLGVSARRMLTALSEGETDPAKLAAMAEPGLRAPPGAVVRCAPCGSLPVSRLPPPAEAVSGANPAAGSAHCGTRSGTGCGAERTRGCGGALGGCARPGRRFSAADHRRSGSASGPVPDGGQPVLLGGELSGTGGIRGAIHKRSFAQRQSVYAPDSQPGGQCGHQD